MLHFVVGVLASAQAWPWNWPTPIQMSVLALVFPPVTGAVAVLVKQSFDRGNVENQHRLVVRAQLLSTSYAYSCEYLMPLASNAGNLASHLIELSGTQNKADRQLCFDAVLYTVAQYIRLESALRSYIPLVGSPSPLGLFLTSEASEDRVWNLIMPAWAFGVRTLEDRSVLVSSLYMVAQDGHQQLLPPDQYLAASRNSGHPLHLVRSKIDQHMSTHEYLGDAILVLYALGDLINYEVRLVLSAWYGGPQEFPASVARVGEISEHVRTAILGIAYKPLA